MYERAEDSVKAYVKGHLDDSTSYQPEAFGKLEKNYSTYQSDDNYFTYSEWIARSEEKSDQQNNPALYRQRKKSGYYDQKYKSGLEKMDSLKKTFKPGFIGYIIAHRYKAKDNSGALTEHKMVFSLDTSLSVFKAADTK